MLRYQDLPIEPVTVTVSVPAARYLPPVTFTVPVIPILERIFTPPVTATGTDPVIP